MTLQQLLASEASLFGRDGDVKYKYTHTYTLFTPSTALPAHNSAAETTLLHKHYKNMTFPWEGGKETPANVKKIFHAKFILSLPASTNDFSEKWCLQG